MAMTAAEKMKRYRERKEAQGFKQKVIWQSVDEATITPEQPLAQEKETERDKWKAELEKEQLASARKEGRRLARIADKTRANGRILGICQAAAFFISKDRVDITKSLLDYFGINQEIATEALQEDGRTKSTMLESFIKVGAFNKPPQALN